MNVANVLKLVQTESEKIEAELRVIKMYLDRDPSSVSPERVQAQVKGTVKYIRDCLNELEAAIK